MSTAPTATACPVAHGRDDRKTAQIVDRFVTPFPGSRMSRSFGLSREILRSPKMRQAGGSADNLDLDAVDDSANVSFFFLDGEPHRKRRASVAGHFTPKAINQRYYPLMERTMDRLIAEFRRTGEAVVDEMTLELASVVTMEILGLDGTDSFALADRVRRIMHNTDPYDKRPLHKFLREKAFGWFYRARLKHRMNVFYRADIEPSVKARRNERRDDVLSYLIDRNYTPTAMTVECMTYATAGVSTTREFMVMALWQMLDHPAIRDRFLAADENEQIAIIEEILRVDPVPAYLYRRPAEPVETAKEGTIAPGELLGIDIRASNYDTAVVGECPFQIDPDRAKRQKIVGAYMSFSDGPHRCPGSQVALHETRVFLNRILRVPGLRLKSEPTVGWSLATQGYELRGAVAACDKAG